jgi:hypothetical protein
MPGQVASTCHVCTSQVQARLRNDSEIKQPGLSTTHLTTRDAKMSPCRSQPLRSKAQKYDSEEAKRLHVSTKKPPFFSLDNNLDSPTSKCQTLQVCHAFLTICTHVVPLSFSIQLHNAVATPIHISIDFMSKTKNLM